MKAYKNPEFLNSSTARNIRILCELEETFYRLQQNKVNATILFFGSARARPTSIYKREVEELSTRIEQCSNDQEKIELEEKMSVLKSLEWMCSQYDLIVDLSRRLTEWATMPTSKIGAQACISGVSRRHPSKIDFFGHDTDVVVDQKLFVISGGGPGFMQAANEGASQVPGSRNIGMAISVPFEKGTNPYVTPELAFEFHYFFTRKFWMVYHCQALIVAPGGLGTFDELFEVLTLKQTGKVQKDLPVVLVGKEFWKTVINWDALFKFGTISKKDVDDLFFTDSAEEAAAYIIERLSHKENIP